MLGQPDGEPRFATRYRGHLLLVNLERRGSVYSSGRGQAQSRDRGEEFLSNEAATRKKRNVSKMEQIKAGADRNNEENTV